MNYARYGARIHGSSSLSKRNLIAALVSRHETDFFLSARDCDLVLVVGLG